MFTGLVGAIAIVADAAPAAPDRDARFTLRAPAGFLDGVALGASICCAGCCLTAVELDGDVFAVEVSGETLARTTLGAWREGTAINLERSLRLGDELGGHLVSGHVDAVGTLRDAEPENGSLRLGFALPAALARFVARKGSIAVDGVSLTVNAVAPDGFAVNIIPHTAAATTLGRLSPGDAVNLEIDLLARYVARLAEVDGARVEGAAASGAEAGPAGPASACVAP